MTRIRKLMRSQRLLILLFLSNLLVPVITNLLSGWLQLQYQDVPGNLIYLVVALTVAGLVLFLAYLWIGKAKPRRETTPDMLPPRVPGLIVIVGTGRKDSTPDELAHIVAINYHLQEHTHRLVCWLIATEGGSLTAANEVVDQYKSKCKDIMVRRLKSGFDIQEAYQLVHNIYTNEIQTFGLQASQVIADFTGGTKPMSAGMILACGDQYPMQYVYGRRGEIESAPVLIKFAA